MGSGGILNLGTKDSYVLTCGHVVKGNRNVFLRFFDVSQESYGTVVARSLDQVGNQSELDKSTDLALLLVRDPPAGLS